MNHKRIIISFSGRCTLSCPFCYSPFNGAVPKHEVVEGILARSKEFGISIVTFGGGDPFQYDFFPACLQTAKSMGFIVHVDTNCCGVTMVDCLLIQDTVDLLGLPLDGREGRHDDLRQQKGHFRIVTDCMQRVFDLGVSVKVNTVVTKQNADEVDYLIRFLRHKPVSVWSLYQFMALERASLVRTQYGISDDAFNKAVASVCSASLPFRVEFGAQRRRRAGYLFAQTDGTLLTHDPQHPHKYLALGSIFEDEWQAKYAEVNGTMLSELSQERYENMR